MESMMREIPEDYIKDLAIRFSHHSTALEGNTLTLAETAVLLLEGITPSRSVHKREIFEIESNARTLEVVLQELNEPTELTEFIIKKIDYFIGENTVTFAGEYKKLNNYIVGADFQTAKASETAEVMAELLENFQCLSSEEAIRENIDNIKDEIADVMIYTLILSSDLGLDVTEIIQNKMIKNGKKYPVEKCRE